jgi:hypothetical protein
LSASTTESTDGEGGVRIVGGHLGHRVAEQEPDGNDRVVTRVRQRLQVRFTVLVAAGFQLLNLDPQVLLGLIRAGCRRIVKRAVTAAAGIERKPGNNL